MSSKRKFFRRRPVRALLAILSGGAALIAIARELRKPAGERTWHGRIGGVIPYDFRRPTLDRIRQAWWNPRSDELLTPRVWGVGWAVNLRALGNRLRAFVGG